MGYRNYFYIMENEELEKIHHFTKQEFFEWAKEKNLLEEEGYIPLYKMGQTFFDFGKYYENTQAVQTLGKPLFSDEELTNRFEEYEPFIVGKEAVLNVIEFQKEMIIKVYEEMLFMSDEERLHRNFDSRSKEDMYKQHIEGMFREWKSEFRPEGCFALNLDEDDSVITKSWKYEYSIFELVRLYKATDWKKYSLLFMGW